MGAQRSSERRRPHKKNADYPQQRHPATPREVHIHVVVLVTSEGLGWSLDNLIESATSSAAKLLWFQISVTMITGILRALYARTVRNTHSNITFEQDWMLAVLYPVPAR